ncbi:MAG: acylphosphatase [Thiobacillus sp.]
MQTLHLQILGRVQGVWFRESMRQEAERLGVTGWVCNRPDGSVEAVIQGSTESIELLLAWTHTGPTQARVERVIVSESEGQFSQFEKRSS